MVYLHACVSFPQYTYCILVEGAGASKQQLLINPIKGGRDLQATEANLSRKNQTAHSSSLKQQAPDQTVVRASFVPAFPLRELGDFQADGRHSDGRLGKKSS